MRFVRGIAAFLAALASACVATAQLPALPPSLARDSALLDATRTLRTELDALAAEAAGPARESRIALRRVAFDLLFRGAGLGPAEQAMPIAGLRLFALRAAIDAEIAKDRADGPAAGPARESRIAVRRVAFDLLFRGAGLGPAEQAMPIAGLRLFALRAAIDAEIAKDRADGPAAAQFREALARFSSIAAHGIASSPTQTEDAALAEALRPLEEAIAAAETRPPAIPSTAWPTIGDPAASKATAAAAAPPITPESWTKAELDAAITRWAAGIAAAHAPSRRPFEAAAKAWAAALRDQARRPAARSAMVALDAELRAFEPGAFERRLRRADPAARESCAGRADDLLREIDRRRADWARGWSDGRGSVDASRAMLRAVRTLEVLDALGTAAAEASVERRLGAWGGFAPPDEGWRIHPKALNARAVLAVEALVARQDDAVDRELAQLDRDLPLVLVADGLARTLDPWLAGRSGIGPRLVAVRDVPSPGAFLGASRGELMLLSRLLIEEQRARVRHDAATADELRVSAAAVATVLLPSVGQAGSGLASLRDLASAIDARAATQRPAKSR